MYKNFIYILLVSILSISCSTKEKSGLNYTHEVVHPDFHEMDTFIFHFSSGNTKPDFFESVDIIITEDTFTYAYYKNGSTKFFKGSPGLELWDKIQPRQELFQLGEDLTQIPDGSPLVKLEYIMEDTILYYNFYSFNQSQLKILRPFRRWTRELKLPGFPNFEPEN